MKPPMVGVPAFSMMWRSMPSLADRLALALLGLHPADEARAHGDHDDLGLTTRHARCGTSDNFSRLRDGHIVVVHRPGGRYSRYSHQPAPPPAAAAKSARTGEGRGPRSRSAFSLRTLHENTSPGATASHNMARAPLRSARSRRGESQEGSPPAHPSAGRAHEYQVDIAAAAVRYGGRGIRAASGSSAPGIVGQRDDPARPFTRPRAQGCAGRAAIEIGLAL